MISWLLQLTSDVIFVGSRQIIDIPPIKVECTEHRIYSRKCRCGQCVQGEFPDHVVNHVSYGQNIQSLIAYWSVRQYIPVKRITEIFEQMMNLKISEGTVINILESFANKCKPSYEMIRQKIENSKCVGSDETGCKVNGKKHWFWIWQTGKLSYLTVSSSRGYETINSEFPNGLSNSILVHDCWSAHFKLKAKNHQLCISHLLRELNYFIELKYIRWPNQFKKLLLDALNLKNSFWEKEYKEKVDQLKQNAHALIQKYTDISNRKLRAFIKRMIKYERYLFTFLDYWDVPPDNNSSERGIRNLKVKQKVSNQFKSYLGAQNFAIIRSVIDTCLKNNSNVFETLQIIPTLATE